MTPTEHAKAIEDAANRLISLAAGICTEGQALAARRALQAAIRDGVGAAPAAPDVAAELEEVKTVCAEAYQVVGSLLLDAGRFDSPEAEKILDNLGTQRLEHTDVLPWKSQATPFRFPGQRRKRGTNWGLCNDMGNWLHIGPNIAAFITIKDACAWLADPAAPGKDQDLTFRYVHVDALAQ